MIQQEVSTSTFALEARGVSVVLGGVKVLDVPSLQIMPNEVLVVIGPNGSGKTTLVLTLAGLLKPASGSLLYHGQNAVSTAETLKLHRRTAVVFQEPLLLNSSVWDNVTLGLRLRGVSKEEIKPRAEKWLERFGIGHLSKRQGRMLSGGEAKRVSLARAFVLEPEILFLDEPFAALDSPTRQALLEDFESVLRETRVTTIMVTHDRNEVLTLADRVAVIMNGSIRQIGSPDELFCSPVDEEVAGFIEAGNVLRGVVSSQSGGLASIDIQGHQLQAATNLAVNQQVTVYLHYEDITISLPTKESLYTSARNQLKGRIAKALPSGSQVKVTMDCGFPLAALITKRSWEEMGLETGREVVSSFKATAIHVIKR